MGKLLINTGAAANDKSGDSLRAAAQKINNNFNELYLQFGDGNTLTPSLVFRTGSYNDLLNKPDLSVYAVKTELFSGSYADLSGKPNLATVAVSGSYADLANKPTLFSGSYTDLTDKPTLFSGSYTDLANKPTLFSGSFDDLTDKPGFFSSLTVEGQADIVALQQNDVIHISAGTNISFETNADSNTIVVNSTYEPTYQEFLQSSTWYKPPGATTIMVEVIGGGGGGGAGAVAATTVSRYGGGGGAGGARIVQYFKASDIGPSVEITVGAGGTAGVGATGGIGNNGGLGGESRFGDFLFTGRAGFGSGGDANSGTFGSASYKATNIVNAAHGSGGLNTSQTIPGGSCAIGCAGGGGAGGAQANSTTASSGANGGLARLYATADEPAQAGVGVAGAHATQSGGGGAGGGYVTDSNGKSGGNGAFPGGGGGGGSAADAGYIPGQGGQGAPGVVRVWTW